MENEQERGKERKKTFVFYKEWDDILNELTDEENLRARKAISAYVFYGQAPDKTDRVVYFAIQSILRAIDGNRSKYDKKKADEAQRQRENREAIKKALEAQQAVGNVGNDSLGDMLQETGDRRQETGVMLSDTVISTKENSSSICAKAQKPKKASPKIFIRPTIEEVQAVIAERGYNGVNAEKFVAFYEANGWVQSGGKPIRDWKAALTTWQIGEEEKHPELKAQREQKANPTAQNIICNCGEIVINGQKMTIDRNGKPTIPVPNNFPPRPSYTHFLDNEQNPTCWIDSQEHPELF